MINTSMRRGYEKAGRGGKSASGSQGVELRFVEAGASTPQIKVVLSVIVEAT